MKLVSMRVRTLTAMGLGLAACQETPPPVTPPVDVPIAPVAVTPSASVTAPPIDLAVDAGAAVDASPSVATVVDASPPPPPPQPSWTVSFPRRVGPQPWCKTEYAVCYDTSKDLSKCPSTHEVQCQTWARPTITPPCSGELMKAISQKERPAHPRACCYDAHSACAQPQEGRPYRPTNGVAMIAPQAHGSSDWCAPARASASPSRAKAEAWARAALLEHASVASFAKLALDLMALGAPPDLVRRAHEAAIDEVDHAAKSFTMAARFDPEGRAWSPGPLVAPAFVAHDLGGLVRETFVDGCIGETIAALEARRRAEASTDDEERTVLLAIADDEERHAELGWRIVAWAARRDSSVLRDLTPLACPDAALRDALVGPCLAALRASVEPKVNAFTAEIPASS